MNVKPNDRFQLLERRGIVPRISVAEAVQLPTRLKQNAALEVFDPDDMDVVNTSHAFEHSLARSHFAPHHVPIVVTFLEIERVRAIT